jgi:hypothetical protein
VSGERPAEGQSKLKGHFRSGPVYSEADALPSALETDHCA